MTSRVVCLRQLTNSCRRDLVHVMLANFSQEEFVLPKATAVGVAEEISPSVVAAINDDDGSTIRPMTSAGKMDAEIFTQSLGRPSSKVI